MRTTFSMRRSAILRRLFVATLGGVICGCQTPSHTQAKQQAEKRWHEVRGRVKFQLAKQQYDGGLFDEAAQTLSEAIALDPMRVEAYVLLARAYLEKSKFASAQQAIDAAKRIGLESADLHYTQGVLLEQRDELDAALAEYDQARILNPADVDVLVARIECLVAAGRAEEALEIAEKNVDRFDASATLSAIAGHLALSLGEEERAVQHFQRASIDARGDPVISAELGLLLARLGRCSQAVPLLAEIVSDAVTTIGIQRRALAACHLTLGDPTAAKGVLLGYAADHPTDVTAQVLLAQACLETDDQPTAARALELAAERAPNDPNVLLTRAALHWRRTEYPVAAELLYTLLETDPEHADAYRLLAQVLRDQNQPDDAESCLRRAAAFSTD